MCVSAVEEPTDLAVVSDSLMVDWVEVVGVVRTVDEVAAACVVVVSDFSVVTVWLDDKAIKVISKTMDIPNAGGLFIYLTLFESLLTSTLFDVVKAGDTMQNVKLRTDFDCTSNLPWLRLRKLKMYLYQHQTDISIVNLTELLQTTLLNINIVILQYGATVVHRLFLG